jgi:hypothetical protein
VFFASTAIALLCVAFAAHLLARDGLARARQVVRIGLATYALGFAVALALPVSPDLPGYRWIVVWAACPITLVVLAQYIGIIGHLRRNGLGLLR